MFNISDLTDACDLGGPRRQFFTSIIREIYHCLFDKDGELLFNDQHLEDCYYYAAGVLIGKLSYEVFLS